MSAFRSAHFGFRHMAVAFVSTHLFDGYTYTIRQGLAKGLRRRGGLGFLPLEHETAETQFLKSLNLSGKVVYDIGGFEGILTLFFASRAAQVITYEPNPRNHGKCAVNVKLNGFTNVRLLNRGLSDRQEEILLVCDPLMPGATSGNPEITRQIRSGTSVRVSAVPVVSLDFDIANMQLPAPDFIKIDIEGMELLALRGMRRTLELTSPQLYIELHGAELPDKIANADAVLDLLSHLRYQVYDVEHGRRITPEDRPSQPPSHIFCTREN